MKKEINTEILIAGASFGGVSAALAAAKMDKKVILVEETNDIGGQATIQGVPLDEHPHIENFGRTKSYAAFRNGVREYYKKNYPMPERSMNDKYFNPGAGWVSALCFEPKVGTAVLFQMLAPYITNGNLQIIYGYKVTSVETDGDVCKAVSFKNVHTNDDLVISAQYILDGTELGELLPLSKAEYIVGAESQKETGEPLALDGDPDPMLQQPFTHVVAVDYLPGENHIIEKPKSYDFWRQRFMYMNGYSDEQNPKGTIFASQKNGYNPSVWNFRRCFCRNNFDESVFPSDITMIMNGNQYIHGVLLDVPEEEKLLHLQNAREQAKSLIYFLQTEIQNGYMGKPGFPGIRPRGDIFGTDDGLAKQPYIRESRRIKAEFTVLEQHFRLDMNPDGPVKYHDSVGVGGYRIDIHLEDKSKSQSITKASSGQHWVQQIPLGALIPIRIKNLIPCCKNIGVTHITNGAFRLHPVEWNIGEAAGILAAYCINKKETPKGVREKFLSEFLKVISDFGIETDWKKPLLGASYYSVYKDVPDWYFGDTTFLK